MQAYKNIGGNSGVRAYEIGEKYIDVQFNSGRPYRYSYESAGRDKVEQMKNIAKQGQGLNTYINRYARMDYEK